MQVQLVLLFCGLVSAYECQKEVNGDKYNIGQLKGLKIAASGTLGEVYNFFACAADPSPDPKGVCKDATICQTTTMVPSSANTAIAFFSDTPVWSPLADPSQKGVMLKFSNGQVCETAPIVPRVATLNFICDESAGIPTGPTAMTVTEVSKCVYKFDYHNSATCPNKGLAAEGLSGGSIFLIILVVCIPLYVVIGCVIKRKKMGTTGMRESCPNIDFWAAIPALVKDGCLFVKGKLTGKPVADYDAL